MNKNAFCITGWHYPSEFYLALTTLNNVDSFIVSHKKKQQIPDFIWDLFSNKKILIRANIGYDWGCFQQFISTGLWRDYETLFFMHDDIKIHDFGFIEETNRLLKEHAVIGNGVGEGPVSFTSVNNHPYAYAHSKWKPVSYTYHHGTVRGSYFATTRKFLEEIHPFEVYWDPFRINIGFGNWSTKATCAKMQSAYGANCFGFLSNTFGKSDFITEYYRGDNPYPLNPPKGFKISLYGFLKRISSVATEIYYQQRKVRFPWLWLRVLGFFLSIFSKKIY